MDFFCCYFYCHASELWKDIPTHIHLIFRDLDPIASLHLYVHKRKEVALLKRNRAFQAFVLAAY